MEGTAFTSRQVVDYAAFYTQMPEPRVPTRSGQVMDEDAIARLRALGYIGNAEPSRVTPRGTGPERTRSAGSYNNEGLRLKALDRPEEAIRAFEHALEIEPKLASALWNLSDLLFANNRDLDRSDDLLLQALAAGLPEAPKYVIGRAISYQRSGHLERSLQLVGPATRVRPEEPEFWLFSGRYRAEKGDCARAVEDFSQGVRLVPNSAPAYSARALARACAGDQAGALDDLRRSLALDPSQARVRAILRDLERGSARAR
jgi:tetratricopeptide (TPR) repeat protein